LGSIWIAGLAVGTIHNWFDDYFVINFRIKMILGASFFPVIRISLGDFDSPIKVARI
jgi:hypothetical protein